MLSIYAGYLWKNNPIDVKGSLDRYRDFLFIDDNIEILLKSLNSHSLFSTLKGPEIAVENILLGLLA